jgi:MSHA biogenesis protein MshJ
MKAQGVDPDASNRARLVQLRQAMAATGGRLQTFEARMVPPEKMQAFLEGLLTRNRKLELLGLKTLPVTQVGAPEKKSEAAGGASAAAATAKAPAEGIYQHGVEIRLAGSYNDLLNYLADLESMPQRVMWNSVSLAVDQYPRSILTLRIYTLSLDRTWLIV